jgi:hypothetical protein
VDVHACKPGVHERGVFGTEVTSSEYQSFINFLYTAKRNRVPGPGQVRPMPKVLPNTGIPCAVHPGSLLAVVLHMTWTRTTGSSDVVPAAVINYLTDRSGGITTSVPFGVHFPQKTVPRTIVKGL